MRTAFLITQIKTLFKTHLNNENGVYKILKNIYGKVLFPIERRSWKTANNNGFESESSLHMCSLLPKKTLDTVIKYYKPLTWLDVGCGTGSSLKYVRKKKIEITGIENSELAIKVSKLKDVILKCDLTVPINLNKHFDLVWCYEVAEHLPEQFADTLINTLTRHANIVVLSAAIPGQGGEGHVNEQLPSYWIKKMNVKGFEIDNSVTNEIHSLLELYSQNVYCFKKSNN